MRLIRILAVVVCVCGMAFSQKVVYQYDRAANFSNLKTYKWITIEGSMQVDAITAQNIQYLVNADLSAKGLVQGTGQVDLLIGFQTAIKQQTQLNWFNDGGPWMGGFGQASTQTIDIGTLSVDVYDPARHQLIWRGSATKAINPSGNADKNYENLQKAINKLLKHFPPGVND